MGSAAGPSSRGAACSIRRACTHAKELAYASERLTSIEVNGTFYRSQTPATFRKWASEVPNGFVFSIKGSRFVTNRRVLKEAGESIKRFLDSGVTELGDKLGPLLWQFAPFKKFDEADFGGFLELLPGTFDGRKLRHVVEVRHDSFKTPEFIALLRKFKIAGRSPITPPIPTSPTSPAISSTRGCNRGKDTIPTAYPPKQLDAWAKRLRTWAEGKEPSDLPRVDPKHKPKVAPRDVFAYVIHEGKVRAPAAAMALIERLKD